MPVSLRFPHKEGLRSFAFRKSTKSFQGKHPKEGLVSFQDVANAMKTTSQYISINAKRGNHPIYYFGQRQGTHPFGDIHWKHVVDRIETLSLQPSHTQLQWVAKYFPQTLMPVEVLKILQATVKPDLTRLQAAEILKRGLMEEKGVPKKKFLSYLQKELDFKEKKEEKEQQLKNNPVMDDLRLNVPEIISFLKSKSNTFFYGTEIIGRLLGIHTKSVEELLKKKAFPVKRFSEVRKGKPRIAVQGKHLAKYIEKNAYLFKHMRARLMQWGVQYSEPRLKEFAALLKKRAKKYYFSITQAEKLFSFAAQKYLTAFSISKAQRATRYYQVWHALFHEPLPGALSLNQSISYAKRLGAIRIPLSLRNLLIKKINDIASETAIAENRNATHVHKGLLKIASRQKKTGT